MPHPTLTKLARNRARLLDLIAPLSEDDLDQTQEGGWTIRDILTHLVNSEDDHTQVIDVFVSGELEKLPVDFDRDTYNVQRVEERGHLSGPELRAALIQQRQQTEDLFTRLDEDQRAISGPHPALGEITVDGIFKIIALHDTIHVRDIQAVLEAAES